MSKAGPTSQAEIARRVEFFKANGYCELPIERHPPEVQAAIQATGMTVLMKQCFQNSQRLLGGGHDLHLTYHEGWARRSAGQPWFQHAWLVWHAPAGDQVVVDLTLEPVERFGDVVYGPSITIPTEEVLLHIDERGLYECIRDRELHGLHPDRAFWAKESA